MSMFIKNVFKKGFCNGLKPVETILPSEWSRRYRVLSQSASAEPGKYDPDRTPYLKEIIDCLSDGSEVEKVSFMKSAQIGGSEALNNYLGYIIHISPGPTMIVQPTIKMAEGYSKQRINPMIELSEELNKRIIDNNVANKTFPGGFAVFSGANSASGLRSLPIKYALMDEIDAYPQDVDGEGDPVGLVEKRTTTFSRRKIFMPSTPTIANISRIEKEYLKGDQRKYHVNCPECEGSFSFDFYQLKFTKNEDNNKRCIPESVFYECPFCKAEIKEFSKTDMMAKGKWIPTNLNADPKNRSYHINSLYSPLGWKSWYELIDEFLEAKEDPFKMKVFKNTVLGETYKEKTQQPDYIKLYNRRENYKFREANKKIVYCVAGADTQNDRLAYIILGFGEDNEIWVLAYNEVLGDPTYPDVWDQFKREIERPIKHESGQDIYVNHTVIDSAGSRTNFVYDFCRRNQDKFTPIIGRGDFGFYFKKSSTIDKDTNGNSFSNALDLYQVNTIQSKKTVYNFLQNETEGSRYVHFSEELPLNFYEMLTSEQLISKIIKGVQKEEFIKPTSSTRNEALDCFGYAYAYAYSKGISNLYGKEYEKVYKINIGNKIKKDKVEEVNVKSNVLENEVIKNRKQENKRKTRFNNYGLKFNK